MKIQDSILYINKAGILSLPVNGSKVEEMPRYLEFNVIVKVIVLAAG